MTKLSLVLSVLAGCTSVGPTGLTSQNVTCDTTLTYENFGSDFISTNCLSCHNNESPRLTTQAQIQSNASRILQEAVYTNAMPENNDISLDERKLLGQWLTCGAP
jgi:uncharacterized membrane protein